MDDLREVIARALSEAGGACNWPHAEICTDAALAAIKQAGFVVVPAEPTEAMLEAGDAAFYDDGGSESLSRTYRAMIEASNG